MRYCFRFLSALLFTGFLSATPEASPSSPLIVPFELHEGHLIVIRSTVGESRVPVRVMIDTGATHSILSRKTARKINAPGMGTARLTAFGSESQAERVILRGLRLGSRTITAACYSADLPWGKVDVLLGLDVLATADLVIDYKRRQLEFGSSTLRSDHSVEFEFEEGLMAVQASIGGRPYKLSVDSGAPVTCLLEPATGVAIRPLKTQYDGILRRLGGTSDLQSAVLPDLRLGDSHWNDLPVWVVRGKRQTRSSLDGVIGLMSLGLQRVQFEFREKRISWGEIQADRFISGQGEGTDRQDADELPFELHHGHMIVVKGFLPGLTRKVNLLIDTGATATVVSRDLAAQVKMDQLDDSRTGTIATAFGSAINAKRVILRKLHLGQRIISRPCLAADLPWKDVDILVGLDILRGTSLTINYAKRRVRFGDPAPASESIPFAMGEKLVVAPVTINGVALRLAVDTGALLPLLYEHRVRSWVQGKVGGRRMRLVHSGGSVQARKVPVSLLQIGRTARTDVDFLILPNEDPTTSIDGFLGTASLGLKKIHLDFEHYAFYVE